MRASLMTLCLPAALCTVTMAGCGSDVLGPAITDGRTGTETIVSAVPACSAAPAAGVRRSGGGIRNDVEELVVTGNDDRLVALARRTLEHRSEPPPPLDFDWSGTDIDRTTGQRLRCDLDMILR